MKRILWKTSVMLAVLMAPSFTATSVHAQTTEVTENGFGIGAVIGNPSGISISLPVGPNNAFDFLVGYDLGANSNVAVLGDYVWHLRDLFAVDPGRVSLYYGPGARALIGRDTEIGLRVVLGIDYIFQDIPLQALFEFAPGVNILPNTNPYGTAGLGLRYYF